MVYSIRGHITYPKLDPDVKAAQRQKEPPPKGRNGRDIARTEEDLFKMFYQAARSGKSAPTNEQVRERLKFHSVSSAYRYMEKLINAGRIKIVVETSNARIVEICGTPYRTAARRAG